MTKGFLANPDLTHRIIEFDLDHAEMFLGGADDAHVAVAFQEDGSQYAALFNSKAKDEGAAANPVASLGRSAAATGNSAFFSDPATAVCGPVIFVGAKGEDVEDAEIERISDGIRAAKNYRDDFPQEFLLWRRAVYNLRKEA
ncbi:hypothetical protein [Corynebacterium callunae]|uniref:Uncharacterized protein n=1 Tax=Corynebacterium callunae DSM 20147 TaxID=1121353 RepID=M1UXM9_9CORY|nr:hypothetical protein [Corynebacterium callunae]AGG66023.1 hypothetical protein H924_02855 [Corynebacterium callunae DSM 20147]